METHNTFYYHFSLLLPFERAVNEELSKMKIKEEFSANFTYKAVRESTGNEVDEEVEYLVEVRVRKKQ